jgi:hypothetical protein
MVPEGSDNTTWSSSDWFNLKLVWFSPGTIELRLLQNTINLPFAGMVVPPGKAHFIGVFTLLLTHQPLRSTGAAVVLYSSAQSSLLPKLSVIPVMLEALTSLITTCAEAGNTANAARRTENLSMGSVGSGNVRDSPVHGRMLE